MMQQSEIRDLMNHMFFHMNVIQSVLDLSSDEVLQIVEITYGYLSDQTVREGFVRIGRLASDLAAVNRDSVSEWFDLPDNWYNGMSPRKVLLTDPNGISRVAEDVHLHIIGGSPCS